MAEGKGLKYGLRKKPGAVDRGVGRMIKTSIAGSGNVGDVIRRLVSGQGPMQRVLGPIIGYGNRRPADPGSPTASVAKAIAAKPPAIKKPEDEEAKKKKPNKHASGIFGVLGAVDKRKS